MLRSRASMPHSSPPDHSSKQPALLLTVPCHRMGMGTNLSSHQTGPGQVQQRRITSHAAREPTSYFVQTMCRSRAPSRRAEGALLWPTRDHVVPYSAPRLCRLRLQACP